jgi:hypothetical protein
MANSPTRLKYCAESAGIASFFTCWPLKIDDAFFRWPTQHQQQAEQQKAD